MLVIQALNINKENNEGNNSDSDKHDDATLSQINIDPEHHHFCSRK